MILKEENIGIIHLENSTEYSKAKTHHIQPRMDQFHERENEEREIIAQSLEQPEQALEQPEEMLDDNILVEFRSKRATAYRVLKHYLFDSERLDSIDFGAILYWYIRVCYFHTTGRRLINLQHVDECYGDIQYVEGFFEHPFTHCFWTGERRLPPVQEVLDEPMLSIEKYDKFLTQVSKGQSWFSKSIYGYRELDDDDDDDDELVEKYDLGIWYGPNGDRDGLVEIDPDTSMTTQIL